MRKADFNFNVMDQVLGSQGLSRENLDPTFLTALRTRAHKISDDQHLDKAELLKALGPTLKQFKRPDISLGRGSGATTFKSAIAALPNAFKQYSFFTDDVDKNRHQDLLEINPIPLRQQRGNLAAGISRAKGARNVEFNPVTELTRLGGVRFAMPDMSDAKTAAMVNAGEAITRREDAKFLDFNKGKHVANKTIEQMMAGRADASEQIKKLKKAGYKTDVPRDFMVFNFEGHPDPVIIGLRTVAPGKDKKAPGTDKLPEGVEGGTRRAEIMPGRPGGIGGIFPEWYDKRDYGMFVICNEVQVVNFGDRNVIMMKKPVIYLYPDKKTQVKVTVQPNGVFSAQYPATQDGVWDVVATPDGTLFDPKTEKRYSYLFWEAQNQGTLSIDRKHAFCVKREDTASFLENVANTYAFNDRERTDFVSFWIPALMQNRYNVIQFFNEKQMGEYATMTIEPKPDAEIRLFMLFEGSNELVPTGNPTLPTLRRGKFTVVEWGGANLDE